MKKARKSAALREVTSKSDATIERETARKWLGRALACYAKFDETDDDKWLVRATGYRDEALEHAALVGDHGRTVGVVQRKLDEADRKRKRRG